MLTQSPEETARRTALHADPDYCRAAERMDALLVALEAL